MRSKLTALAAHFDRDEGWLLEYEGADPGYQTQCLHYLARCHELDRDEGLPSLMKTGFSRFLVHFFQANGTFGGNYGARGTEIVYPGGIIATCGLHRRRMRMLETTVPVLRHVASFLQVLVSYAERKSLLAGALALAEQRPMLPVRSFASRMAAYDREGASPTSHELKPRTNPFRQPRNRAREPNLASVRQAALRSATG